VSEGGAGVKEERKPRTVVSLYASAADVQSNRSSSRCVGDEPNGLPTAIGDPPLCSRVRLSGLRSACRRAKSGAEPERSV